MSLAVDLLLHHLLTASIRTAPDRAAALSDLRRMAAGKVQELCRRAEATTPDRAVALMEAAEELAQIVGDVSREIDREIRRPMPRRA